MVNGKNESSNSLINIDDKKLLIGLFVIFIIGTLFSSNLTGNVGKVKFLTKFESNEFNFLEGSVQLYKGNVVKLERVGGDGSIVVRVITNYDDEQRAIQPGHKIYINGLYITNINTDYTQKRAILRIE